jgi:hypothetical protein
VWVKLDEKLYPYIEKQTHLWKASHTYNGYAELINCYANIWDMPAFNVDFVNNNITTPFPKGHVVVDGMC